MRLACLISQERHIKASCNIVLSSFAFSLLLSSANAFSALLLTHLPLPYILVLYLCIQKNNISHFGVLAVTNCETADLPKEVFFFSLCDLFTWSYLGPTLFPYGQGGFEDLQQVTPLSFKHQVKHFFSLANRRFQEHYSFLFTVFNILQRRAILLQTSLKVKHSSFDHFSQEFNTISSTTIQRMCDRLSQSDEAFVFKSATPEEHQVLRLLKEVNVINTHVPASSAARVAMRNEIQAMIMSKGLPSFYITINPADVYNPLVNFLAGAARGMEESLSWRVGVSSKMASLWVYRSPSWSQSDQK